MFRILLAILMLVSTGVVLTHGCSHDSVSHQHGITASSETDHSGGGKQDDTNQGHCCQFHCHQLVSLAPYVDSDLVSIEPRDLGLSPYKVAYTDPSLALLTRPPLAA